MGSGFDDPWTCFPNGETLGMREATRAADELHRNAATRRCDWPVGLMVRTMNRSTNAQEEQKLGNSRFEGKRISRGVISGCAWVQALRGSPMHQGLGLWAQTMALK